MLANRHTDPQHNDTQHSDISQKFVTPRINDAQHEQHLVTNVAMLVTTMLCVVALSVLFELLLSWVS